MEQYDHIIVGGGIIGCSIAWYLARKGAGRIAVFERNELASAASSQAAGLILQITAKQANTPLVHETLAAIVALEEELDDLLGFHGVGSLRVSATPSGIEALRLLAGEARDQNIPCEPVDEARARSMALWLAFPENCQALFMPNDGYVDPYLLAMAYARAARARGVQFRPRAAVSDILVEGGRVVGVEADGQKISAGSVIDAAGAWAALLSAKAGYHLPMTPVRSHYWICEPEEDFQSDHPITILSDAAAYTRLETGGLVLGVQEAKSKTFDARELPDDPAAFSPTTGDEHWDILTHGAKKVEPFFPGVMSARFGRYVSGLSTYTPDGSILLGPVPGVFGFLAASGCGGNGVALSGGIGRAICDRAMGAKPPFDIAAFDPGRFGTVDPHSANFRKKCAAARASKSCRLINKSQ